MFQAPVTWFYQNFAMGIIGIAVMLAGMMFMAGRMNLMTGIGIIVGALVIGNYQTIVSAIAGIGGSAGFG